MVNTNVCATVVEISECEVLRLQLTCDPVANTDQIFLFVKPLRYVLLSGPPNLRIWLQTKIHIGLHCISLKQ